MATSLISNKCVHIICEQLAGVTYVSCYMIGGFIILLFTCLLDLLLDLSLMPEEKILNFEDIVSSHMNTNLVTEQTSPAIWSESDQESEQELQPESLQLLISEELKATMFGRPAMCQTNASVL